jgi:hypothetical protein
MVILSNRRWQGRPAPNVFGASFYQTAFAVSMARIFVAVTLVFQYATQLCFNEDNGLAYLYSRSIIGSKALLWQGQ